MHQSDKYISKYPLGDGILRYAAIVREKVESSFVSLTQTFHGHRTVCKERFPFQSRNLSLKINFILRKAPSIFEHF